MILLLPVVCLIFTVSPVVHGDLLSGLLNPGSGDVATGANLFFDNTYWRTCINLTTAVYSSFGVHNAMATALFGSPDDTATNNQMSEKLGLKSGLLYSPNSDYQTVLNELNNGKHVKIHIASGLYLNESNIIKNFYASEAASYYHALVTNYNSSYPGGPEKQINDFVKNKTAGKVKDILLPGTINASTSMIVVSTLYFEGNWSRQFLESKTKKTKFSRPGEKKIEVDTMCDERLMNLKRNFHDVDIAQLNFTDVRFSMYIICPHRFSELKRFENLLAKKIKIDDIFTGLQEKRVKIQLPKFNITSTFPMKNILDDAGIKRAFNTTAEFEDISRHKPLYITEVYHKAVIEVKEAGVGGGAAKEAVTSPEPTEPTPTEEFFVDRPCLFILRDNKKKIILAAAKFAGP